MVDVYWFLQKTAELGYHERWPYGPSTSQFRQDLAVQVDAEVRSTPVLAVVTGSVWIVADATFKTCGAFLLPDPTVDQALGAIGNFAFYLRTLDLVDLLKRWKDPLTRKLLRGLTADDQLQYFSKGKFPLPVKAGDELAVLAPESSTSQNGLAQFEVLFAPRRGSYVGSKNDSALGYAKRLLDPANRRRRMDPLAFYYAVKRGAAPGAQIAVTHATHPMWTQVPTLRGLVEVREERDHPLSGAVNLTHNGTPSTVAVTDANWGHTVTVAGGTAGQADHVELARTGYRFTPLPSGTQSSAAPSIDAQVPYHWAVQGIYMDAAASGEAWFVPNAAPLTLFTERNRVTPLVDGNNFYADLVPYLQRVNGYENFIWLAGWWGSDDFDLVNGQSGTTFLDLATAASSAHARIRVILWKSFLKGQTANSQTVNDIKALPNGAAILDSQTMQYGSHHQKFLIAFMGEDHSVAYCGGIDLNPNRLDDANHKVKFPYHDTHARIEGPAITDFMRVYVERWNDHLDVVHGLVPALPTPGWDIHNTTADCFVQVTRTLPRGTHASQPSGVQGSVNAVRRALQRASEYIYIEDQYLFPYWGHVPFDPSLDKLGIVQDLIDALKRIKFLLIVIPNHVTTHQGRYRRHEFLAALAKAAGDNAKKIHVYYLKRKKQAWKDPGIEIDQTEAAEMEQGIVVPDDLKDDYNAMGGSGASGGRGYLDEIYVHTKVWIVDDVYVKCGSMNCNVRGFTYDSECDFHAVDGGLARGKRQAALDFRRALLWEHALAGTGTMDAVPDDIDDLMSWWINHEAKKRIAVYDWQSDSGPGPGRFRTFVDAVWSTNIDPDGR